MSGSVTNNGYVGNSVKDNIGFTQAKKGSSPALKSITKFLVTDKTIRIVQTFHFYLAWL